MHHSSATLVIKGGLLYSVFYTHYLHCMSHRKVVNGKNRYEYLTESTEVFEGKSGGNSGEEQRAS